MIGYEGVIPEVARTLALRGADIIAWPTSWRSPAEFQFIAHERAMENRIVLVAANRQDSSVEGPSILIQPAGYPQNTLASELSHGRRGFFTRFAHKLLRRSGRFAAVASGLAPGERVIVIQVIALPLVSGLRCVKSARVHL